jgi:hypothetical protein
MTANTHLKEVFLDITNGELDCTNLLEVQHYLTHLKNVRVVNTTHSLTRFTLRVVLSDNYNVPIYGYTSNAAIHLAYLLAVVRCIGLYHFRYIYE